MAARFELTRRYGFEAAHRNPAGGARAARLHGHNFTLELTLEDAIDPEAGWFMDYADMDAVVAPVLAALDHQFINEILAAESAGCGPIARWIEARLRGRLWNLKRVQVCVQDPPEFQIERLAADTARGFPERLRFQFCSAHRLCAVSAQHKCSRLHGHSILVEAACNDLDALSAPLREIYVELDHTYLNERPGLENPTSENIALWLAGRLCGRVAGLSLIVVYETPGAFCALRVPSRPSQGASQ